MSELLSNRRVERNKNDISKRQKRNSDAGKWQNSATEWVHSWDMPEFDDEIDYFQSKPIKNINCSTKLSSLPSENHLNSHYSNKKKNGATKQNRIDPLRFNELSDTKFSNMYSLNKPDHQRRSCCYFNYTTTRGGSIGVGLGEDPYLESSETKTIKAIKLLEFTLDHDTRCTS